MKKMTTVDTVVLLLVVVGALNWGLVGLFNFNVVSLLLGTGTTLERVVYVLVGVAGLLKLWKVYGK